MRRRRRAADSSLELLLDTICNTFGGVLFLAILVAMLLQLRGTAGALTAPSPISHRHLQERRARTEELKSELESLHAATRQQAEMIGDLSPSEMAVQRQELEAARQKHSELLTRRAAMATELANTQEVTNQAAQELAKIDSDLAAARQESDSLEESLENETEARTIQARLPVLHETTKRESSYCLRYGRLYRVLDSAGPNTHDFDVQTASNTIGVTPKPNGGQPLGRGTQAKVHFTKEIGTIDPSTTYLAIFVWPDSYGEFQDVKSVMLEKQFEYRLVPLTNDTDTLWQGGADAKVLR